MGLNKYLIYFSYLGKTFLGAQRQVAGKLTALLKRPDDPSTVQGQLEMGLKMLNPCNDPIIYLSSRTDSGVHAFSSTAQVELVRQNGLTYDPQTVTICLNKFFKKGEVPIRVQKTYLVPEEFNCRHHAISRTYLYRLCFIESVNKNLGPHLDHIPIEEHDKCLFISCEHFDVEAMREASQLFLGLHDFRTFMGKGSKEPDKMTRRSITRVDILDAAPHIYSPFSAPFNAANYKYYDIYIEAPGFLYRQVRRMVASLVSVAQGKITNREIKLMLQVPSRHSWDERIKTVPAYALYLCQVEYSSQTKALFQN